MKKIKFILKCLMSLLLMMFILWAILVSLLQTETGQQWLFGHIVHFVEKKTNTHIEIKSFRISFPFKFHLEKIEVSQNQKLFFVMDEVEVNASYSRLIEGRVVLSSLKIKNVSFIDLQDEVFNKNLESDYLLSWDQILAPFYFKIEEINIKNIHFSPTFLKKNSMPKEFIFFMKDHFFNLKGTFTNNPFRKALSSHFTLSVLNVETKNSLLNAELQLENKRLSLSLNSSNFLLTKERTNLPEDIKGSVTIQGSAPTLEWQRLLLNGQIGESPIRGVLQFSHEASKKNPPDWFAVLQDSAIINSRFEVFSREYFKVDYLEMKASHIDFTGSAILNHNQIYQGEFKGEIINLGQLQQVIGNQLNGDISFNGSLTGLLDNPELLINVESSDLSVDNLLFKNNRLVLKFNFDKDFLKGVIDMKAEYREVPWRFSTVFDVNEKKEWKFHQFELNALKSSLTGGVLFSIEDCFFDGIIKGHSDDLSELGQFLKIPLRGEAQIEVTPQNFFWSRNNQKASLKFTGNGFHCFDWEAQQFSANLTALSVEKGLLYNIEGEFEGDSIVGPDWHLAHAETKVMIQIDFTKGLVESAEVVWSAKNVRGDKVELSYLEGDLNLKHPLEDIREGGVGLIIHKIKTLEGQSANAKMAAIFTGIPDHPISFRLTGDGELAKPFSFDLEGSWSQQRDQFQWTFSSLNGQFNGLPFHLNNAVSFIKIEDKFEIDSFNFTYAQAELEGFFKSDKGKFTSQFFTNAIPLDLIHKVALDYPFRGFATFKGNFEGAFDAPIGHLTVELSEMSISEELFGKSLFKDGKIDLTLNSSQAKVDAQLYGAGSSPVSINGTVPIFLKLNPLQIGLNNDLPFELSINADSPLDPYFHLFYNDQISLAGHAQVALKIGGRLNAPQVYGHIDLTNGSYKSLNNNVFFNDIQAHLEAKDSKIHLTQFLAKDDKNGFINAKGSLEVNPEKEFPFVFEIEPSHIFVMDSDYASLSASGLLKLEGNMQEAKLQGKLTVDKATIRLEETLPREIKSVDIRYINVPEDDQGATYQGYEDTVSFIELDIQLDLPKSVFIQGHNLTSEWKGSINVTGTPSDPLLFGELRVIQGEYDLNGKIFELTQGNIRFAGPLAKRTTLYLVASKEIRAASLHHQSQNAHFGERSGDVFDQLRAEIIVKGSVNKPVLSFRSFPPLSQREILSYILFNRGISDITIDQGDQLSQSFISLNSNDQTASTKDFLSRLRNNIGIDRLDIGTGSSENKDYSLQIGKYITENIFVSINKSINAAANQLVIEANLGRNLRAQAEVGDDKQIRTALKWKKDY